MAKRFVLRIIVVVHTVSMITMFNISFLSSLFIMSSSLEVL